MKKRTEMDDEVKAALAELLVGATSDEVELRVLAVVATTMVTFPADAFVIGEPVQVLTIDYEGSPRRGLSATCRRGEGRHIVGFADVVFSPGTEGEHISAIYRAWLGLPPHSMDEEPGARAKRHKAESTDLDMTRPVELIILACKSSALRCRVPGTEREITLRTAVRDAVPGEIITVAPAKQWTHAGHPYLSGKVLGSRLDLTAVGLVPLKLRDEGIWNPKEHYWAEKGEPLSEWVKPIVSRGERPMFEMEQIIPRADPNDFDTDPIGRASDLYEAGDDGAAWNLLMSLLGQELRCLDAHAHLGNHMFEHTPELALRHYAAGVSIGALTLGADFDGVLPWGLIDNRPYLRCLFGQGLCLWRLGQIKEAAAIFRRLLWLNPSDNQGARFNLAEVEAGRPWEK